MLVSLSATISFELESTIESFPSSQGCCALSDYCASKFANVGMDFALRLELAQAGLDKVIKTTIVKPYFINTTLFAGINPGIFPFLQPNSVAKKIVEGILAESHEVIVPGFFTHLLWLLVALPSKCLIPIADIIGGFEFMDTFHGRSVAPEKSTEVNNNLPNQKNFNNNNNNNIETQES